MSRDACELLFGTSDRVEVLKRKTSEKQIRAFAGGSDGQPTITAEELKKLCKARNGFEYLDGYEHRVRQYTITDETVDRYGDVVKAKGVNFENFRKNPVVQFAHDYSQLPIGISVKEWFDKAANVVRSIAVFFDDRVDTSGRSDLIFRFIQSNGMRACSIGFNPTAWVDPDDKQRTELGMGKYGVLYTAWDLMEFSPVPVPANPNALTDAYRKSFDATFRKSVKDGLFREKDVEVLRKFPLFETSILDAFIKELGTPIVTVPEITPATQPEGQAIEKEAVLRPYPNEHACRLVDPEKYDEFRRGTRDSDGKEYSIIWGKVKDTDTWEEQAFRYAEGVWEEDDARKHCEAHNGISFEEATEEPGEEETAPAPTHHVTNHVTINLDVTALAAKMNEIETKISVVSQSLDELVKSYEARVSELLTTTQKALSALESRSRQTSLYDQAELKEALRFPKK